MLEKLMPKQEEKQDILQVILKFDREQMKTFDEAWEKKEFKSRQEFFTAIFELIIQEYKEENNG